MKLILALAFCSALAAQTTNTITLTLGGVSPAVVADIGAHWLSQMSLSFGVTNAALDAVTTSVTVTISPVSTQPLPAVGQTVLMDQEPMAVAGVSGLVLTLTRGGFPNAPLATHAAGVSVSVLKWPTPWSEAAQVLRGWVSSIIQQLGPQSATLGATVSGTVQ